MISVFTSILTSSFQALSDQSINVCHSERPLFSFLLFIKDFHPAAVTLIFTVNRIGQLYAVHLSLR